MIKTKAIHPRVLKTVAHLFLKSLRQNLTQLATPKHQIALESLSEINNGQDNFSCDLIKSDCTS